MRQIILDTETTGLQTEEGHKIIEIGCVELINRKVTTKRFHKYINPERVVEEGALQVHGITNQFLQDKPKFIDIAQEFLDFVSGAELIIHNAPFDVGFINYEMSLINKKWNSIIDHCRIVDSLILARQLHIGQRNSLDALCKRYGIDNSHREYHGALLDAYLLSQVYLAMTGGQGSLFEDLKSTTENTMINSEEMSTPINQQRTLSVLKATSQELAAHDEYLKKLAQKGKCVWLQ